MSEENHDFKQVCRSCLKQDLNLKCIYQTKVSEAKQIFLTDFIRRLTSLKITKCDNFPSTICDDCIDKFVEAYKIAETFLKSDIKLKSEKFNKPKTINDLESNENERAQKQPEIMNIRETQENSSKSQIKTIKMLYEEQGNILKNDDMCETSNDGEEAIEIFDAEIQKQENCDYKESLNIVVEEKVKVKKRRRHKQDFTCNICKEVFSTKKSLNKHEEICDPSKPFRCSMCSQSFSDEEELKVHTLLECKKDDKSFTCDTCGQKFKHKHLLKLHSFKHSDVKPFPCTKCAKGCTTAESLRRHMRIHEEHYEKKVHTCTECLKEFPYKSFLAEHMKTHTGEKPFLCSLCGRGFRQSGALEYHIRTHTGERPYECTVCKKKFTSPGVLKVHMRSHTNERPYVCDICGMAFRQSTDMKTHHRNIHTGDKPILCTLCGKKMSSTGQLTVHLRTHTGEKPYSCSQCSKAFATKTTLVKHERIHTGLKPYQCTICGKAFNQSSTLNTHMRIHKNKNKENVEEKINLNEVVENNCLILKIDESDPSQVVKVEQISIAAAEQVVLLPTPVPLLQNM